MSYVPPSPAKTTTATSSPAGSACRRRSARCALSTPLATAAAFSKATCSQGTFQAVVGIAGGRHLEAARRVDDDDGSADRAEDGADDERDAAALAERVAAAERRYAVLVADERLQTGHGSPRRPT